MLRSKILRNTIAAFSSAALLFVQVAMAAEACMLQAVPEAPAPVAASHATVEQAPCHEMDGGAPQSHCVQRCDVAKQSPDHQPASFTPVLSPIHPIQPSARRFIPDYFQKDPQALLTRATAPPLSVRNCCFRI